MTKYPTEAVLPGCAPARHARELVHLGAGGRLGMDPEQADRTAARITIEFLRN
ncbi:hypothetical protein [Hoeflea sp.]|uniref:hypothetical protein n=1 Tax=Hoeflea sp. TaxID=1940281 RepID=UPI002AFFDACD|nr:hypothetical protein [Hoeflea sp.]